VLADTANAGRPRAGHLADAEGPGRIQADCSWRGRCPRHEHQPCFTGVFQEKPCPVSRWSAGMAFAGPKKAVRRGHGSVATLLNLTVFPVVLALPTRLLRGSSCATLPINRRRRRDCAAVGVAIFGSQRTRGVCRCGKRVWRGRQRHSPHHETQIAAKRSSADVRRTGCRALGSSAPYRLDT